MPLILLSSTMTSVGMNTTSLPLLTRLPRRSCTTSSNLSLLGLSPLVPLRSTDTEGTHSDIKDPESTVAILRCRERRRPDSGRHLLIQSEYSHQILKLAGSVQVVGRKALGSLLTLRALGSPMTYLSTSKTSIATSPTLSKMPIITPTT
ncbi:hypothetical protein ACFX2K_028620 [Malus domestica]